MAQKPIPSYAEPLPGAAGAAGTFNELQRQEIERRSASAPSWSQTPSFLPDTKQSTFAPVRPRHQPFLSGSPLPPPPTPSSQTYQNPTGGGVIHPPAYVSQPPDDEIDEIDAMIDEHIGIGITDA